MARLEPDRPPPLTPNTYEGKLFSPRLAQLPRCCPCVLSAPQAAAGGRRRFLPKIHAKCIPRRTRKFHFDIFETESSVFTYNSIGNSLLLYVPMYVVYHWSSLLGPSSSVPHQPAGPLSSSSSGHTLSREAADLAIIYIALETRARSPHSMN